MDLEEYACKLGRLVTNLQSLEFVLRVFLHNLPGSRPIGLPHGDDLYSHPVGEKVPENDFTSYDSLGMLIEKYNDAANDRRYELIDATLVDVRDALAHGRVSAPLASGTLRLIKFSRPQSNQVEITFNQELTAEWLTKQVTRVHDALFAVQRSAHALNPASVGAPVAAP